MCDNVLCVHTFTLSTLQVQRNQAEAEEEALQAAANRTKDLNEELCMRGMTPVKMLQVSHHEGL